MPLARGFLGFKTGVAMENFNFHRPTAYYFGASRENEVGAIIRALHKRKVLIVYGGGSCMRSGLLARVQASLNASEIEFVAQGGVEPNPRAELVYDLIACARAHQVDFILAVGGGSVIDTAKAVAIGAINSGDFFDFWQQKRTPEGALGVGVILTIPAAGSEGSASSVIQKEVDGSTLKIGLTSNYNIPVFAIMNPELTKTLSAYQSACGAVDMLSHVMERYFTNTPDVSITDHLCEGVMCSIVETAPRVIHEPLSYDARANLMWAGTLAHNDICGVGREQDWATHALEHPLSALYDIAHGAGLAVMFPAWMEYTISHNPMRFAQFANRVFGINMDFEDPKRTAKAGIVALRSFYKSIGMPLNFEQLGAKAEDIPKLIKLLYLTKKSVGRFVQLSPADCEAIYKIAATYQEG